MKGGFSRKVVLSPRIPPRRHLFQVVVTIATISNLIHKTLFLSCFERKVNCNACICMKGMSFVLCANGCGDLGAKVAVFALMGGGKKRTSPIKDESNPFLGWGVRGVRLVLSSGIEHHTLSI